MVTSIKIHFSFIIMDYDVWFIARDGSVSLHLLLSMPQQLLLVLLLLLLLILQLLVVW